MLRCSNLQLKEMVLATLSELELSVSDDDVEAIVDKVMSRTADRIFFFCIKDNKSDIFLHLTYRHFMKQI